MREALNTLHPKNSEYTAKLEELADLVGSPEALQELIDMVNDRRGALGVEKL